MELLYSVNKGRSVCYRTLKERQPTLNPLILFCLYGFCQSISLQCHILVEHRNVLNWINSFVFFNLPLQENCKNEEILLSLKHVRPGNGFVPKFQLLEKVDVNGKDAHPLFQFLREALPFPSDDPSSLISDPKLIIWSPVCRNDVAWNFEKFLIGPDGVPFKRYSRRFLTSSIEGDIKKLLGKAN